jgi:hypothetical protein
MNFLKRIGKYILNIRVKRHHCALSFGVAFGRNYLGDAGTTFLEVDFAVWRLVILLTRPRTQPEVGGGRWA